MIEHAVQSAARNLGAALKLEAAAGGVARVGEGLLANLLLLFVEGLEGAPRHEYLAADFELTGPGARLEVSGDGLDGEDVVYHVVALDAVAAGHGPLQLPVDICQADGHAVELQFAGILQLLAAVGLELVAERGHILFAIGIPQRQHGIFVCDLFEAFLLLWFILDIASNMLSWGVGSRKVGVERLESLQLLHLQVEFKIGDDGVVQDIIVVIMPAELLAERLYTHFCGRF